MKKVLVISPHLDDAILSAFNFLYYNQNILEFTVETFFSSFGNPPLSNDSKKFVHKSKISFKEYENQRKKEDLLALSALNVKLFHHQFTDAGFRQTNAIHHYQSHNLIFSRKLSSNDLILVKKLTKLALKKSHQYDFVLLPMAIGSHIDHIILKRVFSRVFNDSQQYFYFDFPYFLKRKNILGFFKIVFTELINGSLTISFAFKRKKAAIQKYATQLPVVFPHFLLPYPEIIKKPHSKF